MNDKVKKKLIGRKCFHKNSVTFRCNDACLNVIKYHCINENFVDRSHFVRSSVFFMDSVLQRLRVGDVSSFDELRDRFVDYLRRENK